MTPFDHHWCIQAALVLVLRVPTIVGKSMMFFSTEIGNSLIDVHRDLRKVSGFVLHRYRRSNLRRFL